MKLSISIVTAYAKTTRATGYRQFLPWPRLGPDMDRFTHLTIPHVVIMGRRTFEGGELSGTPLVNRRNIVLSSGARWVPHSGVMHATDWDEALQLAHGGFGGLGYHNGTCFERPNAPEAPPRSVFVIGGETVFARALAEPRCAWIFATEVNGDWPGDSFFPELDDSWERVDQSHCPRGWASDTIHRTGDIAYSFVTYVRARTKDTVTLVKR